MTPGYEEWLAWLVAIGYPFDYQTDPPAPVDLDDLARAWKASEPDDDTTAEEWRWSIDMELESAPKPLGQEEGAP